MFINTCVHAFPTETTLLKISFYLLRFVNNEEIKRGGFLTLLFFEAGLTVYRILEPVIRSHFFLGADIVRDKIISVRVQSDAVELRHVRGS